MRKNCSQVVIENMFEPGILYLLIKQDNYGYELKKLLKSECECEVNTGNLYRCLQRLQKLEYIVRIPKPGVKGPARFMYRITQKGKTYFTQWIQALDAQQKRIKNIIKHYRKVI